MNDRELLELAAKAAGFGVYFDDVDQCCKRQPRNPIETWLWNPLEDNGDAFRLMVKLGISTLPYPVYRSEDRHSVVAKQRRHGDTLRELNPTECMEVYGDDPEAATRRAITRAAAEIGRGMP